MKILVEDVLLNLVDVLFKSMKGLFGSSIFVVEGEDDLVLLCSI